MLLNLHLRIAVSCVQHTSCTTRLLSFPFPFPFISCIQVFFHLSFFSLSGWYTDKAASGTDAISLMVELHCCARFIAGLGEAEKKAWKDNRFNQSDVMSSAAVRELCSFFRRGEDVYECFLLQNELVQGVSWRFQRSQEHYCLTFFLFLRTPHQY